MYVMILGFLFFIQTFLKQYKCYIKRKVKSEKYKRYINILLFIINTHIHKWL